jgi:phospholipid/cholesterol/gamma-HCH transport system permease protein
MERILGVTRDGPELRLAVAGGWTLSEGLPSIDGVAREIGGSLPRRLVFDAHELAEWDSALVAFAYSVARLAAERGIEMDVSGLPPGARKLLDLARAVPPRASARAIVDDAFTARVGREALRARDTAADALDFVGETLQAFVSFLRGRAGFRARDLLSAVEASGVAAAGIVALVSFLIGAVLAFVGAVELEQFGAAIYVASLVGIAMARELGPMMTGIVMTGRTGASFAAVLGTMTVNEEVDALVTMGLRPMEFLVLPRVLATALMLPALVAYADFMGMLGGLFVGVTMLHLGAAEYLSQTREALTLAHLWIGLGKSVAFGIVVALTGCYYGIRCGRSAAAVGVATTRAVVMGIVLVVVADAVATVFLYAVGL